MNFNDIHLQNLIGSIYSRPAQMKDIINLYFYDTGKLKNILFFETLKQYSVWWVSLEHVKHDPQNLLVFVEVEKYCNAEIETLTITAWRENPTKDYSKSFDKIKQAREEMDRQHKKVFDKKEKPNMIITIHGNNSAPITQLSESELNNPKQHITTNIQEISPPKRSALEIVSWIVGIIIGLIGIYEFLLKK